MCVCVWCVRDKYQREQPPETGKNPRTRPLWRQINALMQQTRHNKPEAVHRAELIINLICIWIARMRVAPVRVCVRVCVCVLPLFRTKS